MVARARGAQVPPGLKSRLQDGGNDLMARRQAGRWSERVGEQNIGTRKLTGPHPWLSSGGADLVADADDQMGNLARTPIRLLGVAV